MKDKVKFKKFKGEIIALFPNEIWDNAGNITSYMHIGQHSGASRSLLKCRNAKPAEYKDLTNELKTIGYNF